MKQVQTNYINITITILGTTNTGVVRGNMVMANAQLKLTTLGLRGRPLNHVLDPHTTLSLLNKLIQTTITYPDYSIHNLC